MAFCCKSLEFVNDNFIATFSYYRHLVHPLFLNRAVLDPPYTDVMLTRSDVLNHLQQQLTQVYPRSAHINSFWHHSGRVVTINR